MKSNEIDPKYLREMEHSGIHVGDIIEFPESGQARIVNINSGRLVSDKGFPGRFRVTAIREDLSVELQLVREQHVTPTEVTI